MSKYEILYIINPDCQDQEIKSLQEKLHNIFATPSKIISFKELGLKDLAYEINKKNKGFYFELCVEAIKEHINEFSRIIQLESNAYRYLIINLDKEKKYSPKMISELNLAPVEEKPNRFDSRRRPYNPNFNKNNFKKTEKK